MFPVSLDFLLCFVCLTCVSCFPDVLDTLETSGTQDREVRQTKHNGQSRDTGNIRNTGTQDTEVRQTKNNGQSRDTGNIRNTGHRGKTKHVCVVFTSAVRVTQSLAVCVVFCVSTFVLSLLVQFVLLNI
jgi:hypothetical protein